MIPLIEKKHIIRCFGTGVTWCFMVLTTPIPFETKAHVQEDGGDRQGDHDDIDPWIGDVRGRVDVAVRVVSVPSAAVLGFRYNMVQDLHVYRVLDLQK